MQYSNIQFPFIVDLAIIHYVHCWGGSMSILVKSAQATLQYVRTDLQGGLSMMFRRMNPLKDLTGPFQLSDLSKEGFFPVFLVPRFFF